MFTIELVIDGVIATINALFHLIDLNDVDPFFGECEAILSIPEVKFDSFEEAKLYLNRCATEFVEHFPMEKDKVTIYWRKRKIIVVLDDEEFEETYIYEFRIKEVK